MNTITDPLNPDWQITDKGHVLHRSGLGFRIMPDNLLAESARESFDRWQTAELQAGATLLDLPARLAILTQEANQFLKSAIDHPENYWRP